MGVIIKSIEYDPKGPDIFGEYVLIKSEAEDADMTGWTLRDAARHTYRFPSFILEAGNEVRVWTGKGTDDAKNLYWKSSRPIWNNTGDKAVLKDSNGNEVSTYIYTTNSTNENLQVRNQWLDFKGIDSANVWIDDFNGNSQSEMLYYSPASGNWWLGIYNGEFLNWYNVNNSSGFGNLLRKRIRIFKGNFTGRGQTDILFYNNGDGNWYIGTFNDKTLNWDLACNSSGFGDLLRKGIQIWTGDFSGSGKTEILFYYSGDGNWWLGTFSGKQLSWNLANNCAGFGDLLRGSIRIWFGNFTGSGKTDILFHCSNNGDWFLGTFSGNQLNWDFACNSSGFGDLFRKGIQIWTGDFSGSGKTEVLFYFNGDGNWWLGTFTGNKLTWELANNCKDFGNLLYKGTRIWTGDFSGSGKTEILFYYNGDGNWWLGTFNGKQLSWNLANNCAGFGDLLRGSIRIWFGNFTGSSKTDILFHCSNNGDWFLGTFSGNQLNWDRANNSSGFGNLFRSSILMWAADFGGEGKTNLLFHCKSTCDWFMGPLNKGQIQWTLASDTNPVSDFPRQIHIKNKDGHYLQAENKGGGYLSTDGNWPGVRETFEIREVQGTASGLINNSKICLKTMDGYYIQAENGGGGNLNAKPRSCGDWETFTLVIPNGEHFGSGFTESLVDISLKAFNGMYVHFESNKLNANSKNIGLYEVFKLVPFAKGNNTAVQGRVVDKSGCPQAGFKVKATDNDFVVSPSFLGEEYTSHDGYFYISYSPSKYGPIETEPDINLTIYNKSGTTVYNKEVASDVTESVLDVGTIVLPGLTAVPDVSNMKLGPASNTIKNAGLRPSAHCLGVAGNDIVVLDQDPKAGSIAILGSTVTLWMGISNSNSGYSIVAFYNLNADSVPAYIWQYDYTTARWKQLGEQNYGGIGTVHPLEIKLEDQHSYQFYAIKKNGTPNDPVNNPNGIFWQTGSIPVLGNSKGQLLVIQML